MTPTPNVTNDVHLTNIHDDMWQIVVITHVYIDDIEVGQSSLVQMVNVRPKRVPS
jgi:hypothetical protein